LHSRASLRHDPAEDPVPAPTPAPIVIPQHDTDDLHALARDAVRASGLVELMHEIDPGPYGATMRVLELLHALETGIACLVATRRALIGRIEADRRAGFAAGTVTPSEQRFASLVAVFVGLEEALALCQVDARALPPRERHLKLNEYRDLLTADESSLARDLLLDMRQYLGFYRGHQNPEMRLDESRVRVCVGSYLVLAASTAARLGDDGEYQATLDALRDAGVRVNGAEYRGFQRETALPVVEEAGLLPVLPGDIVGNHEVLDAGMSLARAVAGFDLKHGQNPRVIRNPVLFSLGSPGCGKTVTAHAIGNYFLDLCQKNGIPARFRIIRRTDWASHYQNKSANELLRIFRQEIFEFPGVAGAYWPDIDTAFAAREDPGIRAEDKAVLGTLFGLLDGTVGPKNGKWFLIADANHLSMDEAALSRLSQDPHYARGPQTAEDFVELLRAKKLAKLAEYFRLSDDEWLDFGKRCADAGLSGRAVDNIAGKLLSQVDDVDVPDEYFAMAFEDKVALLQGQRKSFDQAHLDGLLDRYIQFEQDAEERARSERFERRVSEIREQLAAKMIAVGGLAE
jgi:hypothetical protein